MLRDDEAEAWIQAQVVAGEPIEVVHERPWGSVRRVPLVEGGVVWFKECSPGQAFEPRLTAALADRWPDRLPDVLAHDPVRGWLLLADAGERLGFDGSPEPWLDVLPRYAELQRGETAHVAEHLDGGVPDHGLASFPALYEAMLARDELPLDGGGLSRLRAFSPRFTLLSGELAARAVPETIQHDDLHGGNVYARDSTLRILDWGDSCVSHPFLTLFVTFLHLEDVSRLPVDDPWFPRLRDAYLEPWGRPAELHETFELAQRLGVFAHVFKELWVLDAIPKEQRARFGLNLPALLARCLATT